MTCADIARARQYRDRELETRGTRKDLYARYQELLLLCASCKMDDGMWNTLIDRTSELCERRASIKTYVAGHAPTW